MKPTEILMAEHRVIEQVLDCLAKLAHDCDTQSTLDRNSASKLLELLSTFADRCHHGKEENQLFTMLERRGLPRHVGPMAVMLEEHTVGRNLITDMRNALADAPVRPNDAARRFHRAASAYVELLRDHIAKEDGVLFPMAESMLNDADREQVLREFAAVERDDLGAGVHDRMLALADELADHFNVPKAATRTAATPSGHCCHGH
jgi:hemerythrin-like domain-containing protein